MTVLQLFESANKGDIRFTQAKLLLEVLWMPDHDSIPSQRLHGCRER